MSIYQHLISTLLVLLTEVVQVLHAFALHEGSVIYYIYVTISRSETTGLYDITITILAMMLLKKKHWHVLSQFIVINANS